MAWTCLICSVGSLQWLYLWVYGTPCSVIHAIAAWGLLCCIVLCPTCLLFSSHFSQSIIFSVIASFPVAYFQWFAFTQHFFSSRCLQKSFSPRLIIPSLWSSILQEILNRSSFALSAWGVPKGLFIRTGFWHRRLAALQSSCHIGNLVICASKQCRAFPSNYINRFHSLLPLQQSEYVLY